MNNRKNIWLDINSSVLDFRGKFWFIIDVEITVKILNNTWENIDTNIERNVQRNIYNSIQSNLKK